jgi:hypothetical protein
MFVEPLAHREFQVLFCLTISIIGKDITLFEDSQGVPACPSDNSYINLEGISDKETRNNR